MLALAILIHAFKPVYFDATPLQTQVAIGRELERKARLVKAVFGEHRDPAELMRKSYAEMLTEAPGVTERSISRLRIHQAACQALGIEPCSNIG